MLGRMHNRWIVIALAAAIGACGGDRPPPPVVSPGAVQVLSPGTGPRQLLRYHVTKGARQRLELSLDVDLDAGGQGGPLPGLVVTNELAIDDVLPDGAARVRTTITDVAARDREGSPISADAMATQTQLMRGLVFTGTLSPEGVLRDVAADTQGRQLPPALANQLDTLAKSFEQVAMPLPATPVGAGATWLHTRAVDQGGMKMSTATTIALVSLDGDTLGFTSTTLVTGKDQAITQQGTTIALSNIKGTGSGAGTVDLARMVMTGELSADFAADMTSDGQTARMGMKMVTRIRPAPADGGSDAEGAGSAADAPSSAADAPGSAGSAADGADAAAGSASQ